VPEIILIKDGFGLETILIKRANRYRHIRALKFNSSDMKTLPMPVVIFEEIYFFPSRRWKPDLA